MSLLHHNSTMLKLGRPPNEQTSHTSTLKSCVDFQTERNISKAAAGGSYGAGAAVT